MNKLYRNLFSIAGTKQFSIAAFLGRLPAGMIGLAIIFPISKFTGSYATAGIVTAFTMAGMALCAPFSGRLVDRFGQCPILLIFAVINFVGTSALIVCIALGMPLIILCLTGVISGASRLSTGTMARTRWAYVVTQASSGDHQQRKQNLQAAYAFESIIDEVVFISAPLLATLLCTAIHPLAGLVCCLISYAVGSVALAVQRKTEPPIHPAQEKSLAVLTIPGWQVIFTAIFFIGISAGALEVIVVARADAANSRSLVGILMAILAFSSMLSGFWYGSRTFKLPTHSIWIVCLALLVIALIPFVFAANLIMLGIALFVAGLLIAPSSIAGQVLIERLLPAKLLNQGMSMLVTAMILGMAAGGWTAGIFIDKFGAYHAGILPVLATLAALLIAILRSRLIIVPEM